MGKIDDPVHFHDFHKNLETSGKWIHFGKVSIIAVHRARMAGAAGAILALRDSSGGLAAAIFIAWSDRAMH